MINKFSRRDFLKLTGLGIGSLALPSRLAAYQSPVFPVSDRLGRITAGQVDLKLRPDADSQTVGVLYENAVVPWLREVTGLNPFRFVQRFVETPDGYIWSPYVQKVFNEPDSQPVTRLPENGSISGMWVEVRVPYVDLVLDNPPIRSPAFRNGVPQRLYYQQVIWVDEIKIDEADLIWYRINERSGSYGDIFWAPGEAFHVIQPEEVTPISEGLPPEEKQIEINIAEDVQTLSCFEAGEEVYFCRISAGQKADIEGNRLEKSATPIGNFGTHWKLHSIHMSGGASGVGWDLIGVAWPTFFATPGIAIHSTFWHNNFGGEYMSHGCVNLLADDARWVWRWTLPVVPYEAVEIRENWLSPNLTAVKVIGA